MGLVSCEVTSSVQAVFQELQAACVGLALRRQNVHILDSLKGLGRSLMSFDVRASPGGSGPEGLRPAQQGGPSASSNLNLGELGGQRAGPGVTEDTPGRREPQRGDPPFARNSLQIQGPRPLNQARAGRDPGAWLEATVRALKGLRVSECSARRQQQSGEPGTPLGRPSKPQEGHGLGAHCAPTVSLGTRRLFSPGARRGLCKVPMLGEEVSGLQRQKNAGTLEWLCTGPV